MHSEHTTQSPSKLASVVMAKDSWECKMLPKPKASWECSLRWELRLMLPKVKGTCFKVLAKVRAEKQSVVEGERYVLESVAANVSWERVSYTKIRWKSLGTHTALLRLPNPPCTPLRVKWMKEMINATKEMESNKLEVHWTYLWSKWLVRRNAICTSVNNDNSLQTMPTLLQSSMGELWVPSIVYIVYWVLEWKFNPKFPLKTLLYY
jgi:hypothetical protein